MLLERKDLRTTTPTKESQIPLFVALSNQHSGVVKTILKLENSNSITANHSSHAFLPPSAVHGSECLIEMNFRADNPITNTVDPNGQPAPSGFGFQVFKKDFLLTQQSRLPLPPSIEPLSSKYLPGKTRAHPNTPNKSFHFPSTGVSSSPPLCLFAFLLYILHSSLDIFSFRKCLLSMGLL